MKTWILLAAATTALPALAADPGAGEALAKKNGCFACHSVEARIIGPAYKDVASRYAGKAEAMTTLAAKLRKGGGGNWGTAGMPPQTQLKDDELHAILEWVLSLKG